MKHFHFLSRVFVSTALPVSELSLKEHEHDATPRRGPTFSALRFLAISSLLCFIVGTRAVAQTDGSYTGTNNDGFVVNNDNSNYWSFLRLQTNTNQAWHILNKNGLSFNFSTTTNYLDAGSEWMRILPSGFVGIGTSTPSYRLHVQGDVGISGNFVFNSGWLGLNVANNAILMDSYANGFHFRSNQSGTIKDLLRVTSAGQLGIGTASPAEALDVVGNIKSSGTITGGNVTLSNSGTGVQNTKLSFLSNSTLMGSAEINTSSSSLDIKSYAANSKINLIPAAGGSVNVTGNFISSGSVSGSSVTSTGALTAGTISSGNITSTGTITAASLSVPSLTTTGALSGSSITASGSISGATLSATGNITSGGQVTGTSFVTTGVLNSGSATLNNTGTGTQNTKLSLQSNGTTMGSAEINTASSSLDIKSYNNGINLVPASGNSVNVTGNLSSTGNIASTGSITSSKLSVGAGGFQGAFLDVSSQNVGVNRITTPLAAGAILANSVKSDQLSSASLIITDATGNYPSLSATASASGSTVFISKLGIGTVSPQQALDVTGNIRATGSLTAASLSVPSLATTGALSGGSISTTGALTAGTISSGNITSTGAIIAQSLSVPSLTTSGALSGSSITTAGIISGGSLSTTGNITSGGQISGASVSTVGALSSGNATLNNSGTGVQNTKLSLQSNGTLMGSAEINPSSSSLDIKSYATNSKINLIPASGGSVNVTGNLASSGSVSGASIASAGALTAGTISSGNITSTGTITAASLSVPSLTTSGSLNAASVSATGSVSGGSILTTGSVTSGSIATGNITSTGTITAASLSIPSLTTSGNFSAATISSGNITSSGNLILNNSTSKIGIGTNTPKATLDVNGSVNVSGNIVATSIVSPITISGGGSYNDLPQIKVGNSSSPVNLNVESGWVSADAVQAAHTVTAPTVLASTISAAQYNFEGSNVALGSPGLGQTGSAYSVFVGNNAGTDFSQTHWENNSNPLVSNKSVFVLNNQAQLGSPLLFGTFADNTDKTNAASPTTSMAQLAINTHHLLPNCALTVSGAVHVGPKDLDPSQFSVRDTLYNSYLLWVQKGIVSEDYAIAKVKTWSDFVFNKDYRLPSLAEVENYITANKHLSDIPSEAEVKENGYSMKKLNVILLQKVEELTLYAIEQQKAIDTQSQQLSQQRAEIEELKRLVQQMVEAKK